MGRESPLRPDGKVLSNTSLHPKASHPFPLWRAERNRFPGVGLQTALGA